jgi:hypothetical protein
VKLNKEIPNINTKIDSSEEFEKGLTKNDGAGAKRGKTGQSNLRGCAPSPLELPLVDSIGNTSPCHPHWEYKIP